MKTKDIFIPDWQWVAILRERCYQLEVQWAMAIHERNFDAALEAMDEEMELVRRVVNEARLDRGDEIEAPEGEITRDPKPFPERRDPLFEWFGREGILRWMRSRHKRWETTLALAREEGSESLVRTLERMADELSPETSPRYSELRKERSEEAVATQGDYRCVVCSKGRNAARRMVAAPRGIYLCEECVAEMGNLIAGRRGSTGSFLKFPRER